MKSSFSTSWNRSKQPRKQRKFVFNAPAHVRIKFMTSTLSSELKKKHNKKNAPVRKGDKVKILRGQFKGKIGVVSAVNRVKSRVYVENIGILKKDSTRSLYPIHPSNLMITEIKLEDKKRKASLERKQNGKKPH
jgi:large subunit ribosomal protein L24